MSRKKKVEAETSDEEPETKITRYAGILSRIFANHCSEGVTEFVFERSEIERVAAELKVDLSNAAQKRRPR